MYTTKNNMNSGYADPRSLVLTLQELSTDYHKEIAEMNNILFQAKERYQLTLNENNEKIQRAQDKMSDENVQIQKEFEELRKMYEKNLPSLNEEKIMIQSQYYKEKSKFDCDFQTKVNEATNKLSEINVKLMTTSKEAVQEIEDLKAQLEREIAELNSEYRSNLSNIDVSYKKELNAVNQHIQDLTNYVNETTIKLNQRREQSSKDYHLSVERLTQDNNAAGEEYNATCISISQNIRMRTQNYENSASGIRNAIEGAINNQKRQVVHSPFA
ncbi:hypothetical protein CPHLJ_1g390 [Cryptosporidium parvum]|uniref:Uncharacterized protein n=3 Tax=Cryptosporidium TaxID=5806 RepID=A0A0S4TBI0_CRYHO|nr:hypothetical protein ChTU502y2012_302g0195 [Cryptosporidium hominis]QOY43591.1 Uncharacterized protein CPATCC_0039010 [Cryptosporidium parvum]WKS75936.1 hypothetical protein CPCDC_1g390 [Cryptosporidium sp. 43IA8]PPA62739.1 hypothetical protein ChUKH1_12720 [Cryptosporidium hominis]PPS97299.1 Uncharacterized protein GY17_00001036 [Cryptosporidium hominis]|eukprot:QOY43591.1 hypothetical protein CPATCC_000392 [Cryptosporidium parvum]